MPYTASRDSKTGLWRGGTQLLRAFRPEISRQRTLIIASFFSVLVAIGFEVLEPWPLKVVFDSLLGRHHVRLPLAVASDRVLFLALAACSLVLITAFGAVADYCGTVCLTIATSRVLAEIRTRLFWHLANLSLSFHSRSRTGDLITRVTGDVDRLREVLVTAVLPFLTNTLTMAAMLAVMLWMNWELALVALFALPVFIVSVTRLSARIKEAARMQRSREGAMAATTGEAMGSIRAVQALSLQNIFLATFAIANETSLREGAKAQRLSAGLERTVQVLVSVCTAVALWLGAGLVIKAKLTPGELLVFLNYLRTAFKPMRQLAKYLGQMSKALASGDRILNLLETPNDVRDAEDAIDAPRFIGRIRFENVTFGYEPGKPVLKNVNFEIQPGQKVGIVGSSGCGKSTLLNLLLRFHDPWAGRILVDGVDIRCFTLESLRAQTAILLQDSVVFAASARDNLAFGALHATEAEILKAAQLANAHQFISDLPNGYDTVLSEHGWTLSGGQRQRVAIARAAIRNAPLLLLDEPTSAQDGENEREVGQALHRVAHGRTTLWISHQLSTIQHCDVILCLDDGRVAEQGSHQELILQGGKYSLLYASQTTGAEVTYAI